jgi:hypothetical protein
LDPALLINLVASPTDAFAAVRGLDLAHMALVVEPENFASLAKLIASLNEGVGGSKSREKEQFARKQSVASSSALFFRAANQLKDDDDSISVKAPSTPPRDRKMSIASSKPVSPISHPATASASALADTQASARRHSSRIDASPSAAKVDSRHAAAAEPTSAKAGGSSPARPRSTRQASKEAQVSADASALHDPMLPPSRLADRDRDRHRDRDREPITNSSATSSPQVPQQKLAAAPKVAPPSNEEAFFSKSALNFSFP